MKLIIREYLASLKERDELDAIMPDLLSELGFTVYSRPGRGTVQHGVDIAAVGDDEDGERKVFLFSLKPGDLTRQDWDGTPQGLRSSLNEIKDVYIPSKIPRRHKELKIVICLCFGGAIEEQVRNHVTGYIEQNATDRISFDEWNGDKIAGHILRGVLREEILPKPIRSSFQKAVAMVDEPDVAYRHFADLVNSLRMLATNNRKKQVRAARQIYVCLWILFVWARESNNIEAPYRASELALLNVWHLLRPYIGKKNKNAKAIVSVLHQLINIHLIIATDFCEQKVFPHTGGRHAISMAVEAHNWVDINLKLFDLLGRMAMTGLWFHWLVHHSSGEAAEETQQKVARLAKKGFELIRTNPTLFSPLCDDQAIDISLFLQLSLTRDDCQDDVSTWLHKMVGRLEFSVRSRGKYLCIFTDYRDLIEHPRDQSDEYFEQATSGSVLIPLLAAWLSALYDYSAVEKLIALSKAELKHCTLQLWLPDDATEDALYIGEHGHGIALCNLTSSMTGMELMETITDACKRESGFTELSPNRTGYWPIILLACRHFRHPVPPQFWIESLYPSEGSDLNNHA